MTAGFADVSAVALRPADDIIMKVSKTRCRLNVCVTHVVAEESNKLDKVLVQIADTVERRTNRQVDQAVRLIEPAILCLVAAGIGFLALGLLLPIFTMASALGQR